MKVRARVKAPEHLPEWARCCEAWGSELEKSEGKVYVADMSTLTMHSVGRCIFCEKEHKLKAKSVRIVGHDRWFPVDLFDLDEGPMEETA